MFVINYDHDGHLLDFHLALNPDIYRDGAQYDFVILAMLGSLSCYGLVQRNEGTPELHSVRIGIACSQFFASYKSVSCLGLALNSVRCFIQYLLYSNRACC